MKKKIKNDSSKIFKVCALTLMGSISILSSCTETPDTYEYEDIKIIEVRKERIRNDINQSQLQIQEAVDNLEAKLYIKSDDLSVAINETIVSLKEIDGRLSGELQKLDTISSDWDTYMSNVDKTIDTLDAEIERIGLLLNDQINQPSKTK